jgi:hypothetical protein
MHTIAWSLRKSRFGKKKKKKRALIIPLFQRTLSLSKRWVEIPEPWNDV